jgi:hypothetical protein
MNLYGTYPTKKRSYIFWHIVRLRLSQTGLLLSVIGYTRSLNVKQFCYPKDTEDVRNSFPFRPSCLAHNASS